MISLIHPSRSRPQQSVDAIGKWRYKATSRFQLLVSVDQDDDYITYATLHNLAIYSQSLPGQDRILIGRNESAIEAINKAARFAEGDILIVVSDDSDCPDDWDVKITDALKGRSGVLKTFDGVQKWIVTMPVMTRDYYNSKGHIYNPDYKHLFPDTHLTHVADLEGKLIIRNDLVFPHNHYSTGKSKKDALNIKNDSTWAHGEATYLRHCRNKFGLGNVDIFNLSKEAYQAGHIAWLKKKLHVR